MENSFPKIRGITRLKYEHTSQGWWARYTRDGVTFSEVFRDNDEKYGSIEASWEAARAWHQEVRTLLPPRNRKEYAEIKKGNNKSGVTGVHKSFRRLANGKRYYWAANWSPSKGVNKSEIFYIDEHGEEKAKQLAINLRKEALKTIEQDLPADYWEYRRKNEQIKETFFQDPFAYEGNEKYDIHKRYERNRELRDKKIELFLEENGYLYCELCNFDFEKEYGEIGKGLIEVHHTVPLAEMNENHKTTIDELICICSNCHLVVHNGDSEENLRIIKFLNSAKKKKK